MVLEIPEIDDDTEDTEEVVVLVLALLREYMLRRFGPPQISAALPLQAMSQPTLPSEAGPP